VLDRQDLPAERPLLARALREAGGDVGLRTEIHSGFAAYYANSDWHESRRHAHIALDLADRLGGPDVIAGTIGMAFMLDFWTGRGLDDALAGRGLAIEEQLPNLPLLSRPSLPYAFALKWSGDIDRARPVYERLRERARSDGDLAISTVLFYNSFHELISEDWDQAAVYADECRLLSVDAERSVDAADGFFACSAVAAYRGDVDRARAYAAEEMRLRAEVGVSGLFNGWALGVLELSLGKHASALARLRSMFDVARATGVREPGLFVGLPEQVEAAIALGELDEAGEVLDFVEEHARRLDRAWALACCERGRAMLASARGDEATAGAAFGRAYAQHARRPQQLPTYELARTLLVHGSILRRRRQKRQASEALDQATAIFDRLGARIYAERARSERARIGGRALAAGDGLTETEQRIADLVAEGKTNKQAALALSLSPKTVEWNLSNIYAKLGVHSRGELTARLRD
jgi:DNA-binding CsgD family transcriptional regulator